MDPEVADEFFTELFKYYDVNARDVRAIQKNYKLSDDSVSRLTAVSYSELGTGFNREISGELLERARSETSNVTHLGVRDAPSSNIIRPKSTLSTTRQLHEPGVRGNDPFDDLMTDIEFRDAMINRLARGFLEGDVDTNQFVKALDSSIAGKGDAEIEKLYDRHYTPFSSRVKPDELRADKVAEDKPHEEGQALVEEIIKRQE